MVVGAAMAGLFPLAVFTFVEDFDKHRLTHYPRILKQVYAGDLVNNLDEQRYHFLASKLLD